jgi:phage gp29-like protein
MQNITLNDFELVLLREALADLKERLTPPPDATDNRRRNYKVTSAMLEQVQDMLRLKR